MRDYVREGEGSVLGAAFARRQATTKTWAEPLWIDLDAVLADDFLQRVRRQLDWAGRGKAGARALDAVRTGLEQGAAAGFAREAALFAEAIVDPEGGKTGIRQFMDKVSPPLPVRRDGVWLDEEHEPRGRALEAAGELLPVGAPFYPGVTRSPNGSTRSASPAMPRPARPASARPRRTSAS